MPVTVHDVERAAENLAGRIVHTPLVRSGVLGQLLGSEVFLKLESQQATGSFKDRGACHKLQLLRAAGETHGVIAASAGNHAQGVALHARRLGIPATIVMPRPTPFSKVARTEAHGAAVVLHGESLSDAYQHAQELAAARGFTFVHPYDDPAIIAGQGTVGLEMLADQPELDVVVVPIGGGGLIAGIATAIKARRPGVRILGVQTELCPSMRAAVRGEPQPTLRTGTLADGIAVKQPGALTQAIVRAHVEDILLVDETQIERAVHLLAMQQKVVAEGAGAAAVAALLGFPDRFAGQRTAAVVSGGNIDARMLANVLLRGLQRDGKIARVRVQISDSPGVLARVTSLIGATGADIIDIEHQRVFSATPPRQAELDVVMETRGQAHVERILADLVEQGFPARVF
jgi:threonine dehydratase